MKHLPTLGATFGLALVLAGGSLACGGKKDDKGKGTGSGAPATAQTGGGTAGTGKPAQPGQPAQPAASGPAQAGCIAKLGEGVTLPDGDLVLKKACGPVAVEGEASLSDRTLTIEPGVELRFGPRAHLDIGYAGPAKLVARGTKEAPIVFTSGKDKEAGAWGGVRLYGQSDRSVVEHAVFEFGGHKDVGDPPGSLVLQADSQRTTVKNVVFRSGLGYGIVAVHDQPSFEGEVTGCEFKGLERGAMSVDPMQLPFLAAGNTFDDKAVIAIAEGNLVKNATLRAGTSYRIFGEVQVARGADDAATPILKIEPGVTVELVSGVSLSVGYANAGGIEAVGTPDKPIRFTGFDKRKGGWGYLGLYGQARSVRIENAIVEFATSNDTEGAIRCDAAAEGTIKDVAFEHLEGVGVSYPSGAAPKCKLEGGKVNDAKALEYKPAE
ncbi:MAG: hypothetical protein HY908_09480 [Myxococcales bacterium]|nr:hypothetical protein [Myxococcales bacterium]